MSTLVQEYFKTLGQVRLNLLKAYKKQALDNSMLKKLMSGLDITLSKDNPLDSLKQQLLQLSRDLLRFSGSFTSSASTGSISLSRLSVENLLIVIAALSKNLSSVGSKTLLSEALLQIPEIDGTLVLSIRDKENGGSGLLKNSKSPLSTVSTLNSNVSFAEEMRNI